MGIYSVDKLIEEARRIAREYRETTGKTLPLTAEIAINDAVRLLQLTPAEKGVTGYDAILNFADEQVKVLIKGRAVFKDDQRGYRLGQLNPEQEWQGILLVLMNADYEPDEIYYATRDDLKDVLDKERNKRGTMSIARFKAIGMLLWSQANGLEDDGYWSNI